MSEDLEKDVKEIIEDLERIAKKLEMPIDQLLPIMTHREIVIMNEQLKALHDHLDWLHDQLTKKKKRSTLFLSAK